MSSEGNEHSMPAVSGRRRRGRLLPGGWVFLVIVLLLMLSSWNTGINLLYLVLGGVLSFVALSVVLSRLMVRGLVIRREAPDAVFREQPFFVGIRIENHKRLMPSISLRLESAAEPGRVMGYLLKVPAQRAAVLNVTHVFPKRGVCRLPVFELVSSFPFGLFESRWRYEDKVEVVVYPRITPVRTSAVERMPGASAKPRAVSEGGDEFFALREYMRGDELRRICWRVSARVGRWMVRELASDHSRYVVLALDTRWIPDAEDFSEHFEEAVELVGSLAVTLLQRQYYVAIATPAQSTESGEGTGHERRLLEVLARVDPVMPEAYPKFEEEVHRLESQQARILYVSPDPREWGQRRMGRAGWILDPREIVHA